MIRLLNARALASVLLITSSAGGLFADDLLTEAITSGKVSFNTRVRYEHADQTGLGDANAITIRPRLGYTTGAYQGLQAMVEFENVTAIDGDSYSQAGINPGGAGRVVIADPETTELNQAWLSYQSDKFLLKGGRQRIVLDNMRFIGDVGWRQNMQTYDAATISGNPLDALTVTYGYLWQVNRVFGEDHVQGQFDSNSHLINAAYQLAPTIVVTGYSFLLDFDNAAANSSATYGLSVVGSHVFDEQKGAKLTYRLEYAYQDDYADQPVNYSADYYAVEAGYAHGKLNAGIGYEVLGSDNGAKAFATPLATLHAFNGWADVFLGTPANGLEDLYGWVGATLPGALGLRVIYHDFKSYSDSIDYGTEWDIQLSKNIDKNWAALLKVADFNSDSTLPDVTRYWAQVEFKF